MNEHPNKVNPSHLNQPNQANPVHHNSTPTPASSGKKSGKGSNKQRILIILFVILTIALAAGLGYLYKKYRDTQAMVYKLSTVQGQQELNKTQIEAILSEMRKLIVIPTGEDPAIATIVDIEQLKSSPFYKDAQNGDRVVLFNNAKKAYIYRPESKIIVNYAAFQPEEPAQQQQPASTTPKR